MNISAPELIRQLTGWVASNALRSLDLALARFIHQQQPDTPAAVLLATALVSERNGHGHTCLDLHAALNNPASLLNPAAARSKRNALEQTLPAEELASLLANLQLKDWLQQLSASAAVADQRQQNKQLDESDNGSPLVLAGTSDRPLLYLRRYWQYEQQIRHALAQRLQQQYPLPELASRSLLARLFANNHAPGTDWQKVACLLAARSGFAIITGGPGTGKTTTVVRLLALLQGLRLSQQQGPLQIHLAAPTGKAAARLSESIGGSIDSLALDDLELEGASGNQIRDCIPHQVTTLHRLLGSLPDSRHFRHSAANPLPTDLVVVDEASMMDVEMMSALVDALPDTARLILLGDKDQLASVEAGSVLADLCHGAAEAHYTPDTCAWLQQLGAGQIAPEYIDDTGSQLQQAIGMLRHSYRFNAYPGIGALATAVNSGQAGLGQLAEIFAGHPDSLQQILLENGELRLQPLKQLVVAGYREYLHCLGQPPAADTSAEAMDQHALAVFAAHSRFQLLTATRTGSFGVEQLNLLIRQTLHQHGLLPGGSQGWYHGRPVLVTRNNYSMQLMNGDIGICMQWPDGSLRVAFAGASGSIRWILPSRLQAVETVFAMTVHKSQGSEFTHTALVLPEYHNPVLTRELIYTAITRSREKFTLVYSNPHSLQLALGLTVERASGLNPATSQQQK